MTKIQEEQAQEAEFTEIPETGALPWDAPQPQPETEPELLKVRLVLNSGSNLEFTINNLINTHESFVDWVGITMKGAKDGGYFIGDYFIQDIKVQFFQHIK